MWMSAGAKGAVRWSAHAILRRSGVAGASRLIKSLPRPAASRALYTASCISKPWSCSGVASPAEATQGTMSPAGGSILVCFHTPRYICPAMQLQGRQVPRGHGRQRRTGKSGPRAQLQRGLPGGGLHGQESTILKAGRGRSARVRALSAKKTEAPRNSGGSPTALEECAWGVRLQGASASSVTRRSSGMSLAVGILYVPAPWTRKLRVACQGEQDIAHA